MKRTFLLAAVALALSAGVALSSFAQGIYWESTTSGGPMGDKTVASRTYYMPKMIKVESDQNGDVILFRFDKEMMYTIQPKDKTYSEMTFAEMEQAMKNMASKTNPKMAELQEKMKNMPEAQRKMMEKMMGAMPGQAGETKFEVQKTGDKKTVTGYNCTKYVITQDGKDFMTIWATKDVPGFDAMKNDLQDYSNRMMQMSPGYMKGLVEGMKKIEGFPLETDMMQGMTNVVTKFEKRSTPVAAFEVPAGYTKVKSKLQEMEEEQAKPKEQK